MHRMGLFLALALLAGCAETGRSGFAARMNTLVGSTDAELQVRMGPPAYDHTYEGRRTIAYSDSWTETYMAPWGGFQEVTRLCEVAFAMDQGRVAGFRTRGTGCGWAGRQNFPQVS